MCSIVEDDFGDEGGAHHMIADERESDKNNILPSVESCHKCGNSKAVYKLTFRQAECCNCFLLHVRHKFRASLGSAKILPKDARLMLIFDGSAESVVLLDMLHHAQTQCNFKRLHCSVVVLYIDELSLIFGDAIKLSNIEIYLKTMQRFLDDYKGFKSYIVPFSETEDITRSIYEFKAINSKYLKRDVTGEQQFFDRISQIQNLSSRQDFVKHHRNKLIAAAAKHFNCQFAFKADISATLASDLLSTICLGRGRTVALDVNLMDDRLGNGIKLIRPLRDINKLEVDLYLKARALSPLEGRYYGDDAGANGSLQNLTRSFIDNLQSGFPSTVSTVFRTGDKMDTKHDMHVNDHLVCSFCRSNLDSNYNSMTLLAVEFSRLISANNNTPAMNSFNFNSHTQYNVLGIAEDTQQLSTLCHSCRNIYRDMAKKSLLLEK